MKKTLLHTVSLGH